MHIAIFGKQNVRREHLQQHLLQYWHDRQAACEVAEYDDAALFCAAMRTHPADLAFLFLEEPAEGFAAARGLREISLECEIVFLADSAAHVADATAFRAMGYLLWPPEPGALNAALERFVHSRGGRHPYAVHTRLRDYLVPHGQIRYFHSDGHCVHVYVEGRAEPLMHLRRLDDIQREVAALPYIRCHQSYLVNRSAIERIDGHWLLLKDGMRLPVSRRHVPDVVTDVKMGVELHNNSQKREEPC